jgi:hypothetical protein
MISDPNTMDAGRAPLPPGPRGLPFLGEAFRYQKDPFGFFVWMREKYGDISHDHGSSFPITQVYSPGAIEHVLGKALKSAKDFAVSLRGTRSTSS